ncbi:TPA: SRPBCC family protein [Serratia odorifera]|nr:SRPBCC family protein [Serratia odorifera]
MQHTQLNVEGVKNKSKAVEVNRWITIGKPALELQRLWCEPHTLPLIMSHFAKVDILNERESSWMVEDMLSQKWYWQNRITELQPGVAIYWQSLQGADLPNEGSLLFREAPAAKGTELSLRVIFEPPGGEMGKKIADWLNVVPNEIVSKALHRFKSLAETGEIPLVSPPPVGADRAKKEA